MNRRQFLTSIAAVGASAALPTSPKPTLGPPCYPEIVDIPFNIYPGGVNYVDMSAVQQRLIETFCMPNSLFAEPLDSRREPWHDPNAGDVPVQE